ncbi:receptor-interacting serine/threonine-protein kinase 3-like [Rhinatrema bivittatum]|uniref:receptor-interacting serine/threonine-protein kinase 3-like n=1 Tax=Rhinatrema bivittatum TaxID=194408 RepID=UPI001128E75A|nr:receptor-interacting serine/threonine-protein kinase 3-like [Rhinatrema bivittatum]
MMDKKVQQAVQLEKDGQGPIQQQQLLTLEPDELKDLRMIQRGGFGDIYRAKCPRFDKEVAVKIIRGAGEFSKQLIKEARMMQRASHPYILHLLGLYKKLEGEYKQFGLIMEYMPIGSLYSLFQKMTPEPVPWPLRFQILHQVAVGMSYLHHELLPALLHLDLKPKNVLLNKSLTVQVTDFGLSKIRDATSSSGTVTGGTCAYMPPEALSDVHSKPQEPFDVYSYGILIWSVLAAQEPYPGACAERIQNLIPKGQRPDERVLDQLGDIKMLPEARNLMVSCWEGVPTARPSFQDCVLKTQEIFAVYTVEIEDAVCTVLDRLKKLSAEEGEMTARSTSTQYKMENSPPGSRGPFLVKHWAAIVSQLQSVDPILKCLLQEEIITRQEQQFILSKDDPAEKNRRTLSAVTRKGEASAARFYQLLEEREPFLVRSLQELAE